MQRTFPETLSLLRRERNISQRHAAKTAGDFLAGMRSLIDSAEAAFEKFEDKV